MAGNNNNNNSRAVRFIDNYRFIDTFFKFNNSILKIQFFDRFLHFVQFAINIRAVRFIDNFNLSLLKISIIFSNSIIR